MRILVVEDDPLILEFASEALREAGYEVTTASDGHQALDQCKQRTADFLVTDIRLPGDISGWEIAEECRKHDPDLPVIYASGFSPVPARPVPGSVCLAKPYRPEDLVKAIEKLSGSNAPRRH